MTLFHGNNETSFMLPRVLQNIHLLCGILVNFFRSLVLSLPLLLKYVYFINLFVEFGVSLVGFNRLSVSFAFWLLILNDNYFISVFS